MKFKKKRGRSINSPKTSQIEIKPSSAALINLPKKRAKKKKVYKKLKYKTLKKRESSWLSKNL